MEKEEFLRRYREQELQMVALPKRAASEYTLLACLKQTEQHQTYLIQANKSGARFLLKCSRLPPKEDLLAEYVMLSTLQSPEFPRVVDYFEENGCSWLAREYFEGNTLCELVEKNGIFPEERAVAVTLQVCAALRHLHTRVPIMVHRDIKPQNILLTPEGECKLIDLGTARFFKPEREQDTVFMGTQATAAPEQFGYRQTDARADIYGVGMLLVYLLTGGYDIRPEKLKGIATPLRRVLQKCLEFAPKRRYSNVDTLAARLRLTQNRRKHLRCALAAVCAVIALAGGTAVWRLAAAPSPEQAVVFKEPLIEQAVRRELGKDKSQPITALELEQVEQLLLCGSECYDVWEAHRSYSEGHFLNNEPLYSKGTITSLEDLRGMKNLSFLALDNQKISELDPLRGLPLRRLNLCGNQITDLSPLKNCKQLNTLIVESNPITRLEPLQELDGLYVLDVGYSGVLSIAPLAGMNIEELFLLNVPLTDYTPLRELPELRRLFLREVAPKTVKLAQEITSLYELTIYSSGITSLEGFAKLKNLRRLDIHDNEVRSLKGLEQLPSLDNLSVGENPLRSLDELPGLAGIKELGIDGQFTDYTPLLRMEGLRLLRCSSQQEKEIRRTLGETSFKIEQNN